MDRQEIRDRRRRLGLTQEQFGRVLGVTARAVGKWEAGDAPISPAIDFATRYLVEHPDHARAPAAGGAGGSGCGVSRPLA
jgi:DNA-binding transcriptional regulator YiaG